MEVKTYQSGDIIFREGEEPDFAYFITQGRVELLSGGENGKVLATYGEGDIFGEAGMIEEEPRRFTARAAQDAQIELFTSDDFAKYYDESSPVVQKLLFGLFNKVKDALPASEPETPAPEAAPASPPEPDSAPAPAAAQEGTVAFADTMDRVTKLLMQRCEQLESAISAGAAGITPAMAGARIRDEAPRELTQRFIMKLEDFGPIKPLLEDESINDILINAPDSIYVERAGKLERTDITFQNDEEVMKIAEKIVKSLGREIDEKRPLVDARLYDGSRVNIIAPPLAVDAPSISIRKFAKKKITLDTMVESDNMSEQLAEFLKVIGKCRLNVIISGGTGSGKTTMLNAISRYIDHSERIVTIEDAAELQLQQPHVVRLETRPVSVNVDPREAVTMRDLVKNSLRMRPDRIIVGEVRGEEVFDMMQAMNTGHEGSLTTIHANHPRDAISRMENMIGMADIGMPIKAIRQQISSAVNIVVQVSRMRDGHRRTTFITEIVGMESETITMQDLFQFVPEGEDETGKLYGSFKWSGIMPRFLRRVAYYGEEDRLSQALGVRLPKL